MTLRFVRWDAVLPGGVRPVLRLELEGVLLTDSGGADCFDSPITAAEAAWRLGVAPPDQGSWIEAAQAALGDPSRGVVGAADFVRVITSREMADDKVHWLMDDGLAPGTGEWALGGASGRGHDLARTDSELPTLNDPLSGLHTAEWSLLDRAVEAAGPPPPDATGATVLRPPDELPPPSDALSGKKTAEWPFAGLAGAGGAPADDD